MRFVPRSASVLSLSLCVASAASALSCTSLDPAPVYLEMNYQVRCLDCEQNAPDGDEHKIRSLDGENELNADCFVSTTGGTQQLSFSATFGDNEFAISQARIEGSDPGASCSVKVIDDGVRYVGDCTSGEPTEEAPCRVKLDEADGIVTGSVYCNSIVSPGNTTIKRYVVSPFTESDAVKFELHNCSGL